MPVQCAHGQVMLSRAKLLQEGTRRQQHGNEPLKWSKQVRLYSYVGKILTCSSTILSVPINYVYRVTY